MDSIRKDVPLETLNWRLKTYHFCKYAGYNYLSDFINKSVTDDIMKIINLGQTDVDEILNTLLEYGYSIDDNNYICPPIKVVPDCRIYEFNYQSSSIFDKLKGKITIDKLFIIATSEESANKILYEKYKIKNAIITKVHDIKEGIILK